MARYYLGDAQLSVRQLVDESGSVTQAQTYAPFILLHQAGDGGGLFGYKGGQSSANGLWYFGNGYFDPQTGQFISQNGDAASPLAAANAVGFFLAPVLFIGWRGRKGKKRIHLATLLFLGILFIATLSSCNAPNPPPATGTPEAPVIPPTGTGTDDATPTSTQPPPTVIVITPESPQSTADPTPTITGEPTCTPESPTPTAVPSTTTNYPPDLEYCESWLCKIEKARIVYDMISQHTEQWWDTPPLDHLIAAYMLEEEGNILLPADQQYMMEAIHWTYNRLIGDHGTEEGRIQWLANSTAFFDPAPPHNGNFDEEDWRAISSRPQQYFIDLASIYFIDGAGYQELTSVDGYRAIRWWDEFEVSALPIANYESDSCHWAKRTFRVDGARFYFGTSFQQNFAFGIGSKPPNCN